MGQKKQNTTVYKRISRSLFLQRWPFSIKYWLSYGVLWFSKSINKTDLTDTE